MQELPVLAFVLAANCAVGGAAGTNGEGVHVPDQQGGSTEIPCSSIPKPGDAGNAGHTNIQIYRPPVIGQPPVPQAPDGQNK